MLPEDLTITEREPPTRARLPPAWLIGMEALPFGLVVGFAITTLPFLLSHAGVPTDRVALVSAIVLSANSWGSLLNPILDVGLTRRAYFWLTGAVSAICMAAALWNLPSGHLTSVTVLSVAAVLAIVLNSGAVQGWTAEFVPESLRGAVGGWFNVAYLGAGALGSLIVMQLATRVSIQILGLGMAGAIVASALPTVLFPKPKTVGLPHRPDLFGHGAKHLACFETPRKPGGIRPVCQSRELRRCHQPLLRFGQRFRCECADW